LALVLGSLFIGTAGSAQEPSPPRPSVLAIALDCQRFDGQQVTLIGAISLGFEDHSLCPTPEFLDMDPVSCLWLTTGERLTDELLHRVAEGLERGDPVVIDGTVSCASRGHMSLSGGSLREITLIASNRTGFVLWDASADDPARVRPEAEASLERLVRRGEELMAAGLFDDALRSFEAADEVELFEVPRYEVLVDVAEARCRLGQAELGRALFRDFRCALEVDRGKLPCFLGPETSTGPGHPNPELTPTCYERMCGEIYLSYYEKPTEAMLDRIDAMSRDADRVEALCANPAPAQD
jgi:hypothetical protein